MGTVRHTCVEDCVYEDMFSNTESESESELYYEWRFTASQFVLATSPLKLTTSNFFPN
jgi:hypothetical protein